jgi:hypothetical protein
VKIPGNLLPGGFVKKMNARIGQECDFALTLTSDN